MFCLFFFNLFAYLDILSFNLLTARENGKINTIQEINEKYRGKHCAMKEKELLKVPTLPVCKFYRSKWYKENEFLFPEGWQTRYLPMGCHDDIHKG